MVQFMLTSEVNATNQNEVEVKTLSNLIEYDSNENVYKVDVDGVSQLLFKALRDHSFYGKVSSILTFNSQETRNYLIDRCIQYIIDLGNVGVHDIMLNGYRIDDVHIPECLQDMVIPCKMVMNTADDVDSQMDHLIKFRAINNEKAVMDKFSPKDMEDLGYGIYATFRKPKKMSSSTAKELAKPVSYSDAGKYFFKGFTERTCNDTSLRLPVDIQKLNSEWYDMGVLDYFKQMVDLRIHKITEG